MGLFDRFFSKKEIQTRPQGVFSTLTAYNPTFAPFNGKTIYDSDIIRSCINTRATHRSKLAVDFLGSAQPKLKTILKNEPNTMQTWSQFLYRCSTILDVYNNCILIPIVNEYDETVGIFPVIPQNAQLVEVDGEPYLKYLFATGKTCCIEYNRCGILRQMQLKDDIFGANNINALKQTLDLISIQGQAIKEGAENSNSYRFYAQATDFMLDDDLAKDQQNFGQKNLKAGGGVLLFPNYYQNIQQCKNTPYTVDAELIKSIQENVYNYFGCSSTILQNAGTEDQLAAFYNAVVEPFAIQLTEVLSTMLFSRIERSNGNKAVVSSNRLAYMNTQSKVSMVAQLADRGAITINEIREIFNLPEIEDERGQMMMARGEYFNTIQEAEVNENADKE